MANSPIITWQSVLTDHQAFTYEALANQAGIEVVPYVVAMEDEIRKIQGWKDSQVSSMKRRLISRNNFFKFCFLVLRERRDSVHIFAAPFTDLRFIPCMLFASWLDIEYYIISESYSPRSDGYLKENVLFLGYIRTLIRPWLYKLYGLLLGSSLAGVFTISQRSYNQFRASGFPISKLFRFGYFVPQQLNTNEVLRCAIRYSFDPAIRIIYVGSLIKTKGFDLLNDLSKILWSQGSKISIDIYGPRNTNALRFFAENIRYRGVIQFGRAQSVMSQYDLVLVPSRYDGWGVVVNEAILAGVPVICSDEVGAGALVDRFYCGVKFKSENIVELSEKLLQLEKDPIHLKVLREHAVKAIEFIDPKIAATYMLKVIHAPFLAKASIPSPWYRS
jgi:glycosyltransferase involved in cell wall biosynthesis